MIAGSSSFHKEWRWVPRLVFNKSSDCQRYLFAAALEFVCTLKTVQSPIQGTKLRMMFFTLQSSALWVTQTEALTTDILCALAFSLTIEETWSKIIWWDSDPGLFCGKIPDSQAACKALGCQAVSPVTTTGYHLPGWSMTTGQHPS
jgi:hypothetical protein